MMRGDCVIGLSKKTELRPNSRAFLVRFLFRDVVEVTEGDGKSSVDLLRRRKEHAFPDSRQSLTQTS